MIGAPVVVADTGPINYLILIGHIDVLSALFNRIMVPSVVCDELKAPKAPMAVRDWIANPPAWLDVRYVAETSDSSVAELGLGAKAAIALAVEVHAELLLMDDRRGVNAALNKGFRVAGTLAVLALAARHNLLNLADAFESLKRTNFHCRLEIMDQFLREQRGK